MNRLFLTLGLTVLSTSVFAADTLIAAPCVDDVSKEFGVAIVVKETNLPVVNIALSPDKKFEQYNTVELRGNIVDIDSSAGEMMIELKLRNNMRSMWKVTNFSIEMVMLDIDGKIHSYASCTPVVFKDIGN